MTNIPNQNEEVNLIKMTNNKKENNKVKKKVYNKAYKKSCHRMYLFFFLKFIILLIQKKFQFLSLDPSVYYVTVAPVYLDWSYVFLLNLMTFVLCFLMLLIPSFIISKITPVKAINFN